LVCLRRFFSFWNEVELPRRPPLAAFPCSLSLPYSARPVKNALFLCFSRFPPTRFFVRVSLHSLCRHAYLAHMSRSVSFSVVVSFSVLFVAFFSLVRSTGTLFFSLGFSPLLLYFKTCSTRGFSCWRCFKLFLSLFFSTLLHKLYFPRLLHRPCTPVSVDSHWP